LLQRVQVKEGLGTLGETWHGMMSKNQEVPRYAAETKLENHAFF